MTRLQTCKKSRAVGCRELDQFIQRKFFETLRYHNISVANKFFCKKVETKIEPYKRIIRLVFVLGLFKASGRSWLQNCMCFYVYKAKKTI